MSDDQGKRKCYCENPDCYVSSPFGCLEYRKIIDEEYKDLFKNLEVVRLLKIPNNNNNEEEDDQVKRGENEQD